MIKNCVTDKINIYDKVTLYFHTTYCIILIIKFNTCDNDRNRCISRFGNTLEFI